MIFKVKRRHIYIFINVFILCAFVIVALAIKNTVYNANSWATIIAFFAIFEIAIQVYQLKRLKISFLNFQFLFILMHYLFFFGRIFVIVFFSQYDLFWNLTNRYTNTEMLDMGLFAICGIQAVFIGIPLTLDTGRENLSAMFNKSQIDIDLFYTGLICLIIGILSSIITDHKRIISTYLTGSYSNLVLNVGLFDDIAPLLLVGAILMICSNRFKRRSAIIIMLLIVAYFGSVMLMSGDRRYQISAVISIVCLTLTKYKGEKKRGFVNMAALIIAVIIVLNFLFLIREFRKGSLQELWGYIIRNPLQLLSSSFFVETLAEFGISFFSLCSIGKYIPRVYSYQYGMTFIRMFGTLLPLGLMKDVSFIDMASPSTVINIREKTSVGATMLGDFYANFGWFSLPFISLFCVLIFNIVEEKKGKFPRWNEARCFIGYYIFLSLVRATISQTVRLVVILLVFPYLLYAFIRSLTSINRFK